MTGLRCPNCGFYNLSARNKCARCGKPLPDSVAQAENQNLFDESSQSGTGSESIPPQPQAPTPAAEPEIELVEESVPVEDQSGLESGNAGASQSMPKSRLMEQPGAATASGTMSKSGAASGSIITGEVVETLDRIPEPGPASSEPEPEPVPERIIPEVPSFDDSAVSKAGTEAELGELSQFFRDAKKKPPAPAKPAKPLTPPPAKPARELKPVAFMDDAASGEAESSLGVESAEPGASAGADDSMSQIKIKARDVSHPSDFNANFSQPVFPEFGAGSAGLEAAEKSESDSAVSRPFEAPTFRITLGGFADAFIYLLIIAAFLSAGTLASGNRPDLPTILDNLSAPMLVAILVVVWFYQVFFISVLGQTPGQILAGIEVLDKSGHRISMPKASFRALVYILCLLPCGLGFIPSLLGNSLPDKAANTKPVKW